MDKRLTIIKKQHTKAMHSMKNKLMVLYQKSTIIIITSLITT
jgi:hypothetical protein